MDDLHQKLKNLKDILSSVGSVAVAFSAGVDSTFLLKTAHDLLGDAAVAVTVNTDAFPETELREAEAFCQKENVLLISISADVFGVDGFAANPPDRCYICKKEIFRRIITAAESHGITCVAEGTNADDTNDYRPGMRAIAELGVLSPLKEAGLTKNDIRALSKELGLKTWIKPSFACLATRIAYGETITADKLRMIGLAEQKLAALGFSQYRVRMHGNDARIEVPPEEIGRFADPALREEISGYCHDLGFTHVSLDLDGYRTGSMNAGLPVR